MLNIRADATTALHSSGYKRSSHSLEKSKPNYTRKASNGTYFNGPTAALFVAFPLSLLSQHLLYDIFSFGSMGNVSMGVSQILKECAIMGRDEELLPTTSIFQMPVENVFCLWDVDQFGSSILFWPQHSLSWLVINWSLIFPRSLMMEISMIFWKRTGILECWRPATRQKWHGITTFSLACRLALWTVGQYSCGKSYHYVHQ